MNKAAIKPITINDKVSDVTKCCDSFDNACVKKAYKGKNVFLKDWPKPTINPRILPGTSSWSNAKTKTGTASFPL